MLASLLGLGSIVVTTAVFWAIEDPVQPSDSAQQITFFRLYSAMLVAGIALGSVALLASRRNSGKTRVLSVLLGSSGVLTGIVFVSLSTQICGRSVLWGYCQA